MSMLLPVRKAGCQRPFSFAASQQKPGRGLLQCLLPSCYAPYSQSVLYMLCVFVFLLAQHLYSFLLILCRGIMIGPPFRAWAFWKSSVIIGELSVRIVVPMDMKKLCGVSVDGHMQSRDSYQAYPNVAADPSMY